MGSLLIVKRLDADGSHLKSWLHERMRLGRSWLEASLGKKKYRKTPSQQKKNWVWWCTSTTLVMVGSIT
jgi:hypothetical protein